MNKTSSQHSRGGKTLIEMTVVIAMMSIVFPLTAKLIVGVMRAGSAGESALVTTTNLSRLSNQFHQDAHAATFAKTDPAKANNFIFQLSGNQTVSYLAEKDRLIRKQLTGEKVTSQEVYRFPHRESQFQQSDKLVTLTIRPRTDLENSLPVTSFHSVWKVKGTIGRMYRFDKKDVLKGKQK